MKPSGDSLKSGVFSKIFGRGVVVMVIDQLNARFLKVVSSVIDVALRYLNRW